MGATAYRPALCERERQLTDILEGVALLVRTVAASSGVTLADLDRDRETPSAALSRFERDQRWRGAQRHMVVDNTA